MAPDRRRGDASVPYLDVLVDHRADGDTRIVVVGEVDAASSRHLEAVALEAISTGAGGSLVVDCAGVSHLDSRGLGVLVELQRSAREHGRHLSVGNPSRAVARLLHLAGLDDLTR